MLSLDAPALGNRASVRLSGFPSFLRANGFAVGGGDAVEVLRATQRVGVLEPDLLRWSLQALLCGRGAEWLPLPLACGERIESRTTDRMRCLTSLTPMMLWSAIVGRCID